MKWKILADSGSCIRHEEKITDEIGFQVVPLLINIGTELFIDDDLSKVPDLMDSMEHSKLGSSTACPSPDTYASAFMDADNVICFTISGALSGSFNSAQLAKNLVLESHPEKNIQIIDTLSAGTEIDILVDKSIELIQAGKSFDDVVTEVENYHQSTGLVFMLESVDNLVKNGRLNRIVGGMIGLLNIRLIGVRSDVGQIEVVHKSKGEKRAYNSIVDVLTKANFNNGRIDISHCLNESSALKLKEVILKSFPQATINIRPTSGLCSYYAQRGGLMVGYETI
ncbi:DegV family protein [Globicatella sulfidifaciens]|uniref:DegV family protein n=1 Tax=Globicatella sulfidifaciens TaxID=136093 RepID=UPI00288CEAB8|nr:DegV family protein [Globicatella sulfidifaciens]MDT2768657.1 DegV family protein [Globicatella sulfidifaciens]